MFTNEDGDGNLVLQNEPDLSSYDNFMTQSDIASFDKNTYGRYMQRSYSSRSWSYYNPNTFYVRFQADKNASSIIQDIANEQFIGTYTISNRIIGADINTYYKEDIDSERAVKGFRISDLLPKGMELTSSKEDIKNSLNINNMNVTIYNLDFKKQLSISELKEITNTDVIITGNWHNTGRTKIEIIVNFNNPIYYDYHSTTNGVFFRYSYEYTISYDSFLEYGNIYTNYCYVDKLDTQEKGVELSITISDNGHFDSDAVDIDEDGDITDELAYAKSQTTITSVISTHQDVQKSVQTDKNYYSTGTVESSLNSEYEYKLRIRTGQNDVTNLIIYDSLEEYAQNPEGEFVLTYGNKAHWTGEFLGIDTSYAESKSYIVKTYYSENVQAGNLYDETHNLNPDWKEYNGSFTNIYEYGEPETITSPNWPNNYNNNMTEANNYWEISKPGAESLTIIFDSTCKLEFASYDYLRFYDKSGNNITASICGISADKIGGTDLTGKTYIIPGDYVKITMRTDGSGQYKGFSAEIKPKVIIETIYATDRTKVKSLAFEYLDADGNPAVIPANSLTYVLIKMKSPTDENITSLAYNGCRTQWQALDEFSQPVDFITGINSNIVKLSLPNTKRGSYLVKHEYYYRDYKGDLILENTISEDVISNIPIDTLIKAEEQNHLSTNNDKQYTFTEDTGDITITENEVQEIILKYVRDEEYGSYQVKHEYYVKEEVNTNALAITFNSKCSGESASYDYLELYYKKDGNTYKLGKYGASSLAGKTINIPSSDFYLYWRTDGSSNQYYGFSIDKIEPVYLEESKTGTTATLPSYTVTELTRNNYPETEHNPYKNNSNLLWHYDSGYIIDEDGSWLKLENTVSEALVPNIPVDTVIKADEQNRIETNNNKQYIYTEDTGDITIEKDATKEIILKYIREQEYGSYQVKHEYYVKDFDNNLTLENTVSEEIVPDIPVDTVIKADEQNHIETNNDKQYTYTEDTGDITIQKDVTQEIIIKYVRDEEYTAELPETGSTDNIKNLIYVLFFLLLGVTSSFLATKKRKY